MPDYKTKALPTDGAAVERAKRMRLSGQDIFTHAYVHAGHTPTMFIPAFRKAWKRLIVKGGRWREDVPQWDGGTVGFYGHEKAYNLMQRVSLQVRHPGKLCKDRAWSTGTLDVGFDDPDYYTDHSDRSACDKPIDHPDRWCVYPDEPCARWRRSSSTARPTARRTRTCATCGGNASCCCAATEDSARPAARPWSRAAARSTAALGASSSRRCADGP